MYCGKKKYFLTAIWRRDIISAEKCGDEESNRLRKVTASRCGCETGTSRETMKITSEQSGPKERNR